MNTNVISLFSGIGGIDLAFEQAGFDIIWANDIDPDACITYQANFGNDSILQGDIRNINADYIPDSDVLISGFPCQSFSVCGNQKGFCDERGNLFFEIMKIIDQKQTPILFLENVANLAEHDNGKTFNIIHNELVSRGYYIRYQIADACDYGVPQHRTRTYIIAFKSGSLCKEFMFPLQRRLKQHIFDIIDKTVKVDDEYYYDVSTSQYKRLYAAITDEDQIYRFADFGIQSSKDGISFTLKANMGTYHNRVPIVKDNYGIRRITPYECLALQGFPKTYRFADIPLYSAYRLCGNSVVVPVVKEIAENIRTVFCLSN